MDKKIVFILTYCLIVFVSSCRATVLLSITLLVTFTLMESMQTLSNKE